MRGWIIMGLYLLSGLNMLIAILGIYSKEYLAGIAFSLVALYFLLAGTLLVGLQVSSKD